MKRLGRYVPPPPPPPPPCVEFHEQADGSVRIEATEGTQAVVPPKPPPSGVFRLVSVDGAQTYTPEPTPEPEPEPELDPLPEPPAAPEESS